MDVLSSSSNTELADDVSEHRHRDTVTYLVPYDPLEHTNMFSKAGLSKSLPASKHVN